MENASKALIMAGGIILAMMLLAMLIYVWTTIGDSAESQNRKILVQQIAEFNKSYLAYDKTKMYGIDVITVVNKAINHNKTIGAEVTDPYYINIIIKPNQTFETIVKKIDNSKPTITEETVDVITNEIKQKLGNPSNSYGAYLSKNVIYNLGTWQNNGQTFIMNNNFLDFFSGDTVDKTAKDGQITYIMSSALTNFKTAIFKCENVEYNEETGRVASMTFKQI